MRQLLTNLVRHGLGIIHAFPTSCTDKNDIHNLIHHLHPINPGIDLVRLGPDGDGGYLVPDDFDGIDSCFSPGVSKQSGFEKDCSIRGMRVFLADGSVEGPPVKDKNFFFMKKFIGATNSEQFMTLDDWVSLHCPGKSDLMLQMDVEGFEYETIINSSTALLARFRIIVLECHNLDLIWSRPLFRFISCAVEKLLQGHLCVHAHPNNALPAFTMKQITIPNMVEFTFLRRDRITQASPAIIFPHPLDCDNSLLAPPLVLPKCWYASAPDFVE